MLTKLIKQLTTVAASGVESMRSIDYCAEVHCMAACTNCPEFPHELN